MGSYTSAAVLLLLMIAVVCFSTSIVDARCPDVTPIKNFDSSRLAGVWYMVEGSKLLEIFECIKQTNKVHSAGVISMDLSLRGIGARKSITVPYRGTPLNGERAKLLFQTSTGFISNFTSTIIDTDYHEYVVWVSCDVKHIEYVVEVTSKRKSISADNRSKVKKTLMDAGISELLHTINQDDCN